jgi:hypothetical protein
MAGSVTKEYASKQTLSHCVLVPDKASKRRCSIPTASFDNAVRAQARIGLLLSFNKLGASRIAWLGVAALDKGATIAFEPRLDPDNS